MKQKKLQPKHYEIFGYSFNPAFEEGKADVKFMAKNKREVIALVKTMLDNFDCEHIAVFRVDGVLE